MKLATITSNFLAARSWTGFTFSARARRQLSRFAMKQKELVVILDRGRTLVRPSRFESQEVGNLRARRALFLPDPFG